MSWDKENLGDKIDVLSGYAFESKLFTENLGTPIIRIRDVKKGNTKTFFNGNFDRKFLINQGDVLVGMDGEFNLAKWNSKPALLNQRVCKISTKDDNRLDINYLAHFLPLELKKIETKASFVTVKHLSVKDINGIQIPLPPLPIQKQIAEILDKADALRKKDLEMLKHYDALAQSLFIDMFGDPVKNEKGWDVKMLDEVCSKITDGEHGTVKRLAHGMPYLMAKNIRDNEIDMTDVAFISRIDHEKIVRRCSPQTGDLLLVCVGATIGRACIVNEKLTNFSLARSVALIKPDFLCLNPYFLYLSFKNRSIQNQIKLAGNSSAQAGLYTGKIKEITIFLPPIDLQNQFAEQIKNIELQKEKVKEQIKASENLFQALLQKMFS